MEDIGRRGFIKGLIGVAFSLLVPGKTFSKPLEGSSVVLPDKPFEVYEKEGKRKGPCVLVIGGIHGNEPGGYKAVDMLVEYTEVKKGKLILVPRANFTSILAFVRGYNGDMNRKFLPDPPKDPDRPFVDSIIRLLKLKEVDYVLSLHDGYGFFSLNPKRWGQCIVIDEKIYNGFDLFRYARYVVSRVNRRLRTPHFRFPIKVTRTFHANTRYPEQRSSLTYFALKEAGKPAFCLEVSRNLPSLVTKVIHHLLLMHYFFEAFSLEVDPPVDSLFKLVRAFVTRKPRFRVVLSSLGRRFVVERGGVLMLKGDVRVERIEGGRGVFLVPQKGDLNRKRLCFSSCISLLVKNDHVSIDRMVIVRG